MGRWRTRTTAGPAVAVLAAAALTGAALTGESGTSLASARLVPSTTVVPGATPGVTVPPTPPAATTPPTGTTGPTAPTATQRIRHLVPSRIGSLGIGRSASVLVRDLQSGEDLVSVRPTAAQMPASLSKLATAVTALSTMGPKHRFETTVLLSPDGSLTLKGGGDATLRTTDLRILARTVATALAAQPVTPRALFFDDTVLPAPSLAPGWPSSYYHGSVSPVRGLVIDQTPSANTSLLAGRRFALALEGAGVPTTARVARRRTPPDSTPIATVQGAPLEQQVLRMLQVSDNDIAETLARHVARVTGHYPDWDGAATARTETLARLGVPMDGVSLQDGSGLSRSSRATAQAMVALLDLAADPSRPELRTVSRGKGLPVAGRTGSLRPARGRFTTAPSRCAAGNVRAKTGLLRDVVGLAGYATGSDGHLHAFSIVTNGPRSSLTLRRKVDALAATITGCW